MSLYFLGGVHGVGKTVLSNSIAPQISAIALTASKLITEEGAQASTPDKRVTDIDGNQERLLRAVTRYRIKHPTIVLDGHFCVRNSAGKAVPIPVEVFEKLRPTALLLLTENSEQIAARLATRDGHRHDLQQIVDLMDCEKSTAEHISARLLLPLKILSGPNTIDDALAFIASQPT